MSYCPECGEEVSEDATFCEACGNALDSPNQSDDEAQESNLSEKTATTDQKQETSPDDGINWQHAGAAGLIALLPAFGVYMLFSIAANSVSGIVFIIALPIFGYLLYKRPTKKAMLGGMCFWLAVEAFLSPVVMLVYTAVFAAQETTTEAGQAGAAIGGTILMVIAFVVGIPLGIVLYLASGRLEPDTPSQSPA